MYLPALKSVSKSRQMIDVFGGYNHNLRIRDNEFFDMTNMSSALYPLLSPRQKRGKVRQFTKPNGLFAHEKLCWVDGTTFYYNGMSKGTVADSPKQFVGMGAFVLIWPDKKYYNSATDEFGSLGASITTSGTVTTSLCKLDGTNYSSYTQSATPPSSPADGALWVNTSVTPNTLMMFSSASGLWTAIPTVYVKIAATGIGTTFSAGDGISISGHNNTALNGNFVVMGAGSGYVVVTAIITANATQATAVTIERKTPDMDFITESENRIWGCSTSKHEIYACKLGDPKNWNSFAGISTDSYAVTVGSNGDFTGCCTHLGDVLFFKEDIIHKLYGTKPANYKLTNTICRGVQKGSEKSLVTVNETLYYKSRHDVCVYAGALPSAISDALGEIQYKEACAGAYGSKLYISMKKPDNSGVLFVFDEEKRLWHKEDGVYASYFAAIGSELYFINAADKWMYSINGNITDYAGAGAAVESSVAWSAETGMLGLDSPDKKYVSQLQIRATLTAGATLKIYVQYDGSSWVEKYSLSTAMTRSYTVPIIPQRCDVMRMKFEGTGEVHIYSIAKTIEQGSGR